MLSARSPRLRNASVTVTQPEMRPARVLDLYCGQGGAAMGYSRAGFEVAGVDIKDQPRYPFEFIKGDAIEFLEWLTDTVTGREFLAGIDLIHASPPCQRYSAAVTHANKLKHPDLIGPTRVLLEQAGLPYVIENVPGAPLMWPVELCGCMFDMFVQHGPRGEYFALRRPRLFEASFPLLVPEHSEHIAWACPVIGRGSPGWFYRKHGFGIPAARQAELMGTEWMSHAGTVESIPPIFTEFIGIQARALIRRLSKSDYTEAA